MTEVNRIPQGTIPDPKKEQIKVPLTRKIFEFLSGLPMTIAAGIFLAISLALILTKTSLPIDPAWVTIAVCGYPLFYLAVWRIIYNDGLSKISSALLISIAVTAAVFIGEIFAAGEVAFIMAIGAILEDKTVERAKKGIKQLIGLAPQNGRVVREGFEEMVRIEDVIEGDILRILPGEAVPVDGRILFGNTSIDQSIITGESLPVDKGVGDEVFCGTVNLFGSVDIKAMKVGEDSSLQKLIRLVREAEDNKAPMQRIADKWASWLVPLVSLIALATYFVTGDITRSVTILVVFCPCALVLSTPAAIMAAVGQATKHGVVIKSGDALERMGKVDTVAFDKTGTLTYGSLVVSDAVPLDTAVSGKELLAVAASAEAFSEHPLGKAVAAHAKGQGIQMHPIDNFKMMPGRGISADMCGRAVLCGNVSFLRENGIDPDAAAGPLERLHSQGKATILVSLDGRCIGIIALSDTLRETAENMVREIKEADAEVVLLTGDNRQAANHFSEKVGIEAVHAELIPAQKVELIQKMQDEGRCVCMIGDGVNDAPALKAADVGVAMGSMGSDIAIEAADIALMGDDIAKIPYLKRLSNATVRLIRFNIAISMSINAVAVILSMFALLNPVTGALVHNAGSVLVVLNAALLYDRKYI